MAVRVLQKLMVLEHGETIDPGDSAIVESAYDSSYALLEVQKLTSWGSTDDIPTGAELPIINYVSEQIKGAFQVPADVRQLLPYDALKAEIDLAILVGGDYVPDDTPADYF